MGGPTKAISAFSTLSGANALRRQRGFTYLMLLLWVALAGVMLAALGTSWHTMSRRDREAELIWRGEQYRRAFTSYAQVTVTLQAASASAVAASAAGNAPGSSYDLSNSALTPQQLGTAASASTGKTPQTSLSPGQPLGLAGAAGAASGSGEGALSRGPLELKDLLEDRRTGKLVRHLRQVYGDPITNSTVWGLDRGPDRRIRGIYSLSNDKPLRESLGVQRYRDLVFSSSGAAAPNAASAASGADNAVSAAASAAALRRR